MPSVTSHHFGTRILRAALCAASALALLTTQPGALPRARAAANAEKGPVWVEVIHKDAFGGIESATERAFVLHASESWTSVGTGTSPWIQARPEKYGPGEVPLKLFLNLNPEAGERRGKLVIRSQSGKTVQLEIVQKKAEAFRFEVSHKKFEIADLGNAREFRISSSAPWRVTSPAPWLRIRKNSGAAGVEIIQIGADKNTTASERKTTLAIQAVGHPEKTITIPVVQGRVGDYYNDGEVLWLTRHKRGKGVPVIIVGDGFDRQDLKKGGFWEKAARTLGENFKRCPVVRDLCEDYIDLGIYMAESAERGTSDDFGHNIARRNTKFGGHNCEANYALVLEKIKVIPGINKQNVHACFVANGPFGGWAMGWFAFLPLPQVSDTYWILHEFTGHILGRMPDFYDPGPVVNATKKDLENYHKEEGGLGWMLDHTNDPEKVVWKDFLKRPEYVREGVGFHKAGYYGGLTVYVPEDFEKSPMKRYTGGFTALERYQLWKRIMWIAGEDWSTERFFKYDIPTNVGKSHFPLWPCERPEEIREWWKDIRVD
ncbi:MAG: BACON domain-containing protein [Puniceicoccales bacterium]|jgi:hypothetical protein|nr:BACON domain-containing protein [Puniceicoccales bacterium]